MVKRIIKYGMIITPGFLTVSLAFLRITKIINFSSDWFYVIAGAGLTVEGVAYLIAQGIPTKENKTYQKKLNEF